MKTAISSFANSDPAHSRGPPPNGMKLLLLVDMLGQLDEDPRNIPLFCSIITITPLQGGNNEKYHSSFY